MIAGLLEIAGQFETGAAGTMYFKFGGVFFEKAQQKTRWLSSSWVSDVIPASPAAVYFFFLEAIDLIEGSQLRCTSSLTRLVYQEPRKRRAWPFLAKSRHSCQIDSSQIVELANQFEPIRTAASTSRRSTSRCCFS